MYLLTGPELSEHRNSEDWWDPQCRVTTKRGTRCQHMLFGGQVHTEIDGQLYLSEYHAMLFRDGICPFHRQLHDLQAKLGEQ